MADKYYVMIATFYLPTHNGHLSQWKPKMKCTDSGMYHVPGQLSDMANESWYKSWAYRVYGICTLSSSYMYSLYCDSCSNIILVCHHKLEHLPH